MSQTNRRGSVIFLHGLQSPNFWVWLWHVYTLALPTSVLRNRYLSSFYCTLAIIVYSFVGAGPLDGLGRRKGGRRSQRPSRTMCMAQNSHGYPLTTAWNVSRQRQGPGCNKWGEGLVELVLYQVIYFALFILTWSQTLYRASFYLSLFVDVNVTNRHSKPEDLFKNI